MVRLAVFGFLAAKSLLFAFAQESPDYNYSEGDSDFESSSDSGLCYFPAGNVAYGNVPCNPNAEVSTCCGDISHCLANGLCAVGDTSDGLGGFLNSGVEFARGSCTDPTWQDPACFQHCLSSQPGSPDSNGAAVFECGSEGYAHSASYCCENGIDAKTACCATSTLLFELGPGTYGSMSSPTSASSPSQTPTTVTTTVVSDQTYTVPDATSPASVVPLPGTISSPVSVPSAFTPLNATASSTALQASSFHRSNASATQPAPSVFTGAATREGIPFIELGAIAFAALAYL